MTRRMCMLLIAAAGVLSTEGVTRAEAAGPIRCLIITGDHGHDWKSTTPVIQGFLSAGGKGLVIYPSATAALKKDTEFERYSNSVMFEDGYVLATAWCDPAKPKGTGRHAAVAWVSKNGRGRGCTNVLGHDTTSIADKNFQKLLRRGGKWAATGKVGTLR